MIQERNINTGEMVEFEVSGDKIEAIYMIPGWTHNIINLSDTEDLVIQKGVHRCYLIHTFLCSFS